MMRGMMFSGGSDPLTSATITSVTGTLIEGSSVTFAVSWVGGKAPFSAQISNFSPVTGLAGQSTSITITANSNANPQHVVTVTDALGASVTSPLFSSPVKFFRVGTAGGLFNPGPRNIVFLSNATGNPTPTVNWFISVNGGAFQNQGVGDTFTSPYLATATTYSGYYTASNAHGSGTSNTVSFSST